jgi:hypothetical protein
VRMESSLLHSHRSPGANAERTDKARAKGATTGRFAVAIVGRLAEWECGEVR